LLSNSLWDRIGGMGSFGVAGIIIKRKNFSESDRILTVMTRNLGKIKVIAKGVRKITSRRAPTIDLLCLSQLQIYEGKTFYTLSESVLINDFCLLKGSLKKIRLAFHVCELTDALLPEEQAHKEVYELLLKFMQGLCEKDISISDFEIKLLKLLGYWSKELEGKVNNRYYIEEIIGRKLRSLDSYR